MSRPRATDRGKAAEIPAKKHSTWGLLNKKQSSRPIDHSTMSGKPADVPRKESIGTSYHTAEEYQQEIAFVDRSKQPQDAAVFPQVQYPKGLSSMPLDVSRTHQGKGKKPIIKKPMFRIQDLNDDAAVISRHSRSDSLSPADSGIDMLEEDSSRPRLRARASSEFAGPSSAVAEHLDDMERLLVLEQSLCEEIDCYQQEWQDELRTIAIETEQVLERQRQEEEDRLRALEIQVEEERIAAELAQLRECVCCGDSKNPSDFSAKTATDACTHPPLTCKECMECWLAFEFEIKGPENIKCPECPSHLTHADVQRHASEKTFEAYEKILTRNALSSLPEFSWCLSSTCNSGQLNAENANFMDCVSCGYKQCLTHRIPWHIGETCSQYDYRTSGQKQKDEEAATEAMLDSVSKLCPGRIEKTGEECGWRIQKISGCEHMTCRRCRHEFCWVCLASHRQIKKEGNTAHQEWCKFHSNNLDVAWPFNAHA